MPRHLDASGSFDAGPKTRTPQGPERRSASDGVGKVRLRINVGKSRAGVIGLWLVAWSKILKGWEGESRRPAAGTGETQRALYPKVVWILAAGRPRKWHHRQIADMKLKGAGDKPPRRGDDDRRISAKLPPGCRCPPRPSQRRSGFDESAMPLQKPHMTKTRIDMVQNWCRAHPTLSS